MGEMILKQIHRLVGPHIQLSPSALLSITLKDSSSALLSISLTPNGPGI